MQVLEQIQRMSPERFLAIYQSLEQQGFGPLDGEVAKLLKFRPQAIRKLPMEQRARTARRILEGSHNAQLAYELLGAYLIKNKKELVTGFLDATGVKHQDGMIEDVDKEKPAAEKLGPALAELDQKFPPEDVTIYLAICAEQWPDVGELDQLWRARAGSA
jgi:uncharacterized protein (UPF0297 family)